MRSDQEPNSGQRQPGHQGHREGGPQCPTTVRRRLPEPHPPALARPCHLQQSSVERRRHGAGGLNVKPGSEGVLIAIEEIVVGIYRYQIGPGHEERCDVDGTERPRKTVKDTETIVPLIQIVASSSTPPIKLPTVAGPSRTNVFLSQACSVVENVPSYQMQSRQGTLGMLTDAFTQPPSAAVLNEAFVFHPAPGVAFLANHVPSVEMVKEVACAVAAFATAIPKASAAHARSLASEKVVCCVVTSLLSSACNDQITPWRRGV